ncbi:LOB domain-containing protein 42 [Hibiscus syriacus]|uniref:LOB domain-containing protein 42 n=1 Tax=Hibiscus syriacus TaxID=106335 RepID=A0A6A3A4S6_HIBSY|nr:LOB domain-containing protein 42 [Hibiscus syriacus]
MRMSCNGCRVLRKGCTQDCIIRPCLQWIKSPDSQANATLFLAKFYGRAGLLNLIEAGPENLRPAIFRSLLYEACGRVVNSVYGSVGMLWSGNWVECQAAVDADHNTAEIDKVVKSRARFKRSANKSKRRAESFSDNKEEESMFSIETLEDSLVNRTKKGLLLKFANQTEESVDIRLELTLFLAPAKN